MRYLGNYELLKIIIWTPYLDKLNEIEMFAFKLRMFTIST